MEELIKKPGCDASNMYDEEISQQEQEFSDDEKEKEYKRKKKMKKQGKLEEGEIQGLAGKKRKSQAKEQSYQGY